MTAPAVGRFGRTPPPPPGKLYVRDPQVGWGLSIVDAVQRFKTAGEKVPEHLVELAGQLPADLPESSTYLIDSDFGPPLPPYASAEPLAPAEPETEQEEGEEEEEAEEAEEIDLEQWTVPELKDALDQLEVEYPANARKAELIELLEEAEQ